jgi:hypothetical protein
MLEAVEERVDQTLVLEEWVPLWIVKMSLLQNTACEPEFFAAGGESGGCGRPFLA